jgi:hypothetical protein
MKLYLKHFRPLTSEDVELIRKKQGNINDIIVALEKTPSFFLEDGKIHLIVEKMPQLNYTTEGYYISNTSHLVDDGLPQIMTKEVYNIYMHENDYYKNNIN